MSGFESIVAPQGKRTTDEWVNGNLVALLGALYLYVWRGVTSHGKDLDQAEYVRFRKALVTALKKARETVEIPPSKTVGGDDDDEVGPWVGWTDIRVKDLDTAALRINRHGWLEMNWAAGIQDLVRMEEEAEDRDMADEADTRPEPRQVRKADTMFQERYDYLSERRRKDYAIWKQGILARIKELERDTPPQQAKGEDAMDIDED